MKMLIVKLSIQWYISCQILVHNLYSKNHIHCSIYKKLWYNKPYLSHMNYLCHFVSTMYQKCTFTSLKCTLLLHCDTNGIYYRIFTKSFITRLYSHLTQWPFSQHFILLRKPFCQQARMTCRRLLYLIIHHHQTFVQVIHICDLV